MVEGYTDVIGLVQAGIENAVATCGTALGEAHFRLLSRFAQRAILAFDSDEAGARAAERAYAFQETYPVQAVVMIMPQGLDPADFVAKHGADGVRAGRGRVAAARRVHGAANGRAPRPLDASRGSPRRWPTRCRSWKGCPDPVRRSEYGHLLADLAGVSETSVMQSLEQRLGGQPARGREDHEARDGAGPGRARDVEAARARRRHVPGRSSSSSSRSTSATRRTARMFVALRAADGDVAAIAGGEDPKLASAVSALAVEPLNGGGDAEYARSVWARLQEFLLKSRSDAIRMRLQKLNPTTDTDLRRPVPRAGRSDGELRRLGHGERSWTEGRDAFARAGHRAERFRTLGSPWLTS